MHTDWIHALLGGVLIGIAVSVMLIFNGKVTGVSGIVNGVLAPFKAENLWRWYFIAGLILGGFLLVFIRPMAFSGELQTETWTVIVAGLLVGFGTTLGSGCTSGHGVCGISRLSFRSVLATILFILAGIVAVAFLRKMGVFV